MVEEWTEEGGTVESEGRVPPTPGQGAGPVSGLREGARGCGGVREGTGAEGKGYRPTPGPGGT